MEALASLWGYQESIEDLQHKLLCTLQELEALRNNAKEEMRKSQENIDQLILLLKVTSQERDEARVQLQTLINNINQPTPVDVCPVAEYLQPLSPQMFPIGGNSSVTESDSLSATPKGHSHGSSPVGSFFDPVSSPDLSNINMGDSCHTRLQQQQSLLIEQNNSTPVPAAAAKYDQASAILNELASKRGMPEKGKFLQAVMDAGPLLQTLMLAGPLPRWRNPPPLQPFQIPPVSIKSRAAPQTVNKIGAVSQNYFAQASANGLGPQMCSASMMNLGSRLQKRSDLLSCRSSHPGTAAKRQISQ